MQEDFKSIAVAKARESLRQRPCYSHGHIPLRSASLTRMLSRSTGALGPLLPRPRARLGHAFGNGASCTVDAWLAVAHGMYSMFSGLSYFSRIYVDKYASPCYYACDLVRAGAGAGAVFVSAVLLRARSRCTRDGDGIRVRGRARDRSGLGRSLGA